MAYSMAYCPQRGLWPIAWPTAHSVAYGLQHGPWPTARPVAYSMADAITSVGPPLAAVLCTRTLPVHCAPRGTPHTHAQHWYPSSSGLQQHCNAVLERGSPVLNPYIVMACVVMDLPSTEPVYSYGMHGYGSLRTEFIYVYGLWSQGFPRTEPIYSYCLHS